MKRLYKLNLHNVKCKLYFNKNKVKSKIFVYLRNGIYKKRFIITEKQKEIELS